MICKHDMLFLFWAIGVGLFIYFDFNRWVVAIIACVLALFYKYYVEKPYPHEH